MKKTIIFLLTNCLLNIINMSEIFANNSQSQQNSKQDNVYELSFVNLVNEQPIKLTDYKGKVLLIVNTASKCGFTKQYQGLEKLYQRYKDRGLVIIGIPSDNFGGQEFADNQEIKNFCKYNYGVSFLMTQRLEVVGDKAHPFFMMVKSRLGTLASPKWNFYKYLVNRDGVLVDYFISSTEPESQKLTTSIEKLL